jgi:hypothetical protein
VETVQKIHGDEIAQVWEQIKQFGKTSFMEWQATGTSSFMQKEVLTNKIRAFAEFAMSNPITAPLIDARELLQQTWDVMEIGKESPILDEDKSIPEPLKQQMGRCSRACRRWGALQQAGQRVQQAGSRGEVQGRRQQGRAFKAENERLQMVLPYLPAGAIAAIAQERGPAGARQRRHFPADATRTDAGGGDASRTRRRTDPQQQQPPPSGGFSSPLRNDAEERLDADRP